jgi:DNA helicase HerA-like ATPase
MKKNSSGIVMMGANILPFDISKRLGTVVQVAPSRITVRSVQGSSDTSKIDATTLVNIGDYVVLGRLAYATMGQVVQIRLPETGEGHFDLIVNLFTSVALSEMRVLPGVVQPAQLGDPVFLPTQEIVNFVISGNEGGRSSSPSDVRFHLAHLMNVVKTPVHVSPERLFGRHCAILGATGGGKSWTLARIVEESTRYRSKVLLFDATGEYGALDGQVMHLHFGKDTRVSKHSEQSVVPYYHLNEQDLFAMFCPTGASQAPKLRAAIKSLKLVALTRSVGVDGLIIKAHKSKVPFERALSKYRKEVDSPFASFDIHMLPQQLENECVEQQRSSSEPDIWGGTNAVDLGNCMPLISRILDMLEAPFMGPILKPKRLPSIFEKLHDFIRGDEYRVLRIDMSNLSSGYGVRRIIANALARHIFDLGQAGCFQKQPFLMVLDEAHQLFSGRDEQNREVRLNMFDLIAKEGRKYSINLCMATQRPRDIPDDILSQMGTLIVHRLINDSDRAVIERASSEVDESSLRFIPSLGPGEAIISGVDFPLPLRVRIEPPDAKPSSAGANYQRYWSPE